tara:strand:- start:2167 stop:2541 length:375 start_codon:yes stop_codon:yes gene_type:complete
MAKKLSKGQLVSKLKKQDILVPKSAKVEDMEHRLKHWQGGGGFLVRLLRVPVDSRWKNHPVQLLTNKRQLYWLPRSEMAKEILESKIVMNLGNTSEPSNDAQVIDIPSDYRMVKHNGSNDSADS